jgi:BolA family transcriptional regulator, general stress-responsive regulator
MSLLKREVRGSAIERLWCGKGKRQEKVFLDFPAAKANYKMMKVADTIRQKLAAGFAPIALEVRDESARHAGHAGATRDDGSQGETHFHVHLVSAAFEGLSRVERQRRIHAALDQELKATVHALSLTLLTPAEAAKA